MQRVIFFCRLFAWFCLRYVARHRLRALAVLLGIALGAAVFTSVRLSVKASLDAFTRSVDRLAGTADAVVSRPGGRVPEETLRILMRLPAVAAFSPISSVYVRPGDDEEASFLLVGIDPLLDRGFRDWQAGEDLAGAVRTWTGLIAEPFSVLVGRELALAHGWSAGQVVTLVHARRKAAFRILAVLETRGLALAEGGLLAITDIATFQEFSETVGHLDRVDVRIAPSAGQAGLQSLREALPPGVRASPASTARESGRGMIRSYQLNLTILSFASLFVGMFLVYSLVALNAASRRGEIAVLRSLGASKRTVFLLFLAEGGVYGLAGWLLAIPLGGVLTRYLLEGVSRTVSTLFVRVVVSGLDLSPWEVAGSLLTTLGVSLLAALHPSRGAMAVPPAEAVQAPPREGAGAASPGRLASAGAVCVLAVAPLSLMPAFDGVPVPGYGGILFLFAGFSLLAPWPDDLVDAADQPGGAGHARQALLGRGHEKVDVFIGDADRHQAVGGNGVDHEHAPMVVGQAPDLLYRVEHAGAGFVVHRGDHGDVRVLLEGRLDGIQIGQARAGKFQVDTGDVVVPGDFHHPRRVGPVVDHQQLPAFRHQGVDAHVLDDGSGPCEDHGGVNFRVAVDDLYQVLPDPGHEVDEFLLPGADVRHHLGVLDRVAGGGRPGVQQHVALDWLDDFHGGTSWVWPVRPLARWPVNGGWKPILTG